MKCPKCKRDMNRKKIKDNNYYYECSHCHTTIGYKKNDTGNDTQDNKS